MPNVDWQGFLAGIRESIERIRTPIDPVQLQGTAHEVSQRLTVAAFTPGGSVQFGSTFLHPPSDGYNRVTFLHGLKGTVDVFKVYNQPQRQQISGYALSNQLTGAHINPSFGTWYTIEIPDRNCYIQFVATNDSYELPYDGMTYAIFWRQY